MAKKQAKIYSIKEITTRIKCVLEENLPPRMTVCGQLSGWRPHVSGHSYFTLKDEKSILPCVMWKSRVSAVSFNVEDGMEVLATGNIDVYPQGGKYQFYVDRFELAGTGSLQIAFEEMKRRLLAEGLFNDEHKKMIPAYPSRIGIVTSASGAAVKDIADSVYSRWPCVKLMLYPVAVQGDNAAPEIAAAIRSVNRRNSQLKVDILIVGRGGGSMEDLWAFNEEVVARAIFDSEIPVISAVGHEIDFTIADFVADARASTPTKAGIIAVPDILDVVERLSACENRLRHNARSKVDIGRSRLETVMASSGFRNPYMIVNNAAQQVDEIQGRLFEAVRMKIAAIREKLNYEAETIARIEPHRLLGKNQLQLTSLAGRLETAMNKAVAVRQPTVDRFENRIKSQIHVVFSKKQLQLTAIENRLSGLNPKSVLDRGYSITTVKKTGEVLVNPDQMKPGDRLVTELADEKRVESEVVKPD